MARGLSLLFVALLCGLGVVTAQPPNCQQLDINSAVNITLPVRGESMSASCMG